MSDHLNTGAVERTGLLRQTKLVRQRNAEKRFCKQ